MTRIKPSAIPLAGNALAVSDSESCQPEHRRAYRRESLMRWD
jgi:hypothetical protein